MTALRAPSLPFALRTFSTSPPPLSSSTSPVVSPLMSLSSAHSISQTVTSSPCHSDSSTHSARDRDRDRVLFSNSPLPSGQDVALNHKTFQDEPQLHFNRMEQSCKALQLDSAVSPSTSASFAYQNPGSPVSTYSSFSPSAVFPPSAAASTPSQNESSFSQETHSTLSPIFQANPSIHSTYQQNSIASPGAQSRMLHANSSAGGLVVQGKNEKGRTTSSMFTFQPVMNDNVSCSTNSTTTSFSSSLPARSPESKMLVTHLREVQAAASNNFQSQQQLSVELQKVVNIVSIHHHVQVLSANMLGQFHRDVLRLEGCPFCLGQKDLAEDSQTNPYSQHYALLTCQVLECRHMSHLSCLVLCTLSSNTSTIPPRLATSDVQSVEPAEAPPLPTASTKLQVALDVLHGTASSRVLSSPLTPFVAAREEVSNSRMFQVDFGFSHIASNARQLAMSWASMASRFDSNTKQHALYVCLSKVDADDCLSPLSEQNTAAEVLRFHLPRGRLMCRVVDLQSKQVYETIASYDLSAHSHHQTFKVVHVESTGPLAHLPLTLGVQRGRDARGYVVSSLRLDLPPATNESSLNVDTSIVPTGFSVLCSPHASALEDSRSPLFGSSSTSFNTSAREFVPNTSFISFSDASNSTGSHRSYSTSNDMDESYGGMASNNCSPCFRSRGFGSASGSHAASPVPSSRSTLYQSASTVPSNSSPQFSPHSHVISSPTINNEHLRVSKQANTFNKSGSPLLSSVPSVATSRSSPLSLNRMIADTSSRSGLNVPRSSPQRSHSPYMQSQTNTGNGQRTSSYGEREWEGGNSGLEEDEDEAPDNGRAYHEESNGMDSARLPHYDNGCEHFLSHQGENADTTNEQSPLYLPALPTFPATAPSGVSQVNLGTNPLMNLTVDMLHGNVMKIIKTHPGSRFVQQKLETGDSAFLNLFFDEMKDHVAELMIDSFAHFAVEMLMQHCSEDMCLHLLQLLAPTLSMVACQKHGSFSVQALVDMLQISSHVYTLCESMHNDILRLITHASGHFVVLRMLQRFPFASTRFIDEAIANNVGIVATDHHGLRVFKAVLCIRRSTELTRLFKQVARLTMKLVENQYANYAVQVVLEVAPPGVRTNIKVKMEGKYMRLSKQKFSSNVVELCLKKSSARWRAIIIKELTVQPAVAELLRDRYGNYVLQTALTVASASQVQEIMKAITPYLPSLRDNVRAKWKKMLKRAGAAVARGEMMPGDDPNEPLSPVDLSYEPDSPHSAQLPSHEFSSPHSYSMHHLGEDFCQSSFNYGNNNTINNNLSDHSLSSSYTQYSSPIATSTPQSRHPLPVPQTSQHHHLSMHNRYGSPQGPIYPQHQTPLGPGALHALQDSIR